ncbi:MAG: NAD-dependent epimerase/dehydratase family protein [Elusimicrobiota bacterium]
MKNILVLGSDGFIGKNLFAELKRLPDIKINKFDIDSDDKQLEYYLKESDIVFHLAGVNRPQKIEEFETGNVVLTQTIIETLEKLKRNPSIVFTSSIQAELDNPYGISKRKAEDILIEYSKKSGAKIYICRFPNVFGKWCRPNYNSVVSTFCHNITRGLDIEISDVNKEIELIYIDDIVSEFMDIVLDKYYSNTNNYCKLKQTFNITLGKLAEKIYQMRDVRKNLTVPDFSDEFTRCLYATYLSYLPQDKFSYNLELKTDQRGSLAEILKSPHFGQIFVSKTKKGIVRGNHYHNTKIEKFCVIQGKAVIKFRHILEDKIISYQVSGEDIKIVDIPPGYTHSIENTGNDELIVLFWADEIFNSQNPDTYFEEVGNG